MTASRKAPLVFLKLGGSLLGDKRNPRSFRRGVVARLGVEILRAMECAGPMRLLLAHGGGGPAHCPAKRFRTREGLSGGGGWRGFAETRRGVIEMNRRVLDALARGGLRPVLLSPSAGVSAENETVKRWDLTVIRAVLDRGQVPLVHGDVVMDVKRGFTILSTEELFLHLAPRLRPERIVLACDVEGVYVTQTRRTRRAEIVPFVNRSNIGEVRRMLSRVRRGPRRRWDVTGGMPAKVERLYELACRLRGLEVRVVSGLRHGTVERALAGDEVGTQIRIG